MGTVYDAIQRSAGAGPVESADVRREQREQQLTWHFASLESHYAEMQQTCDAQDEADNSPNASTTPSPRPSPSPSQPQSQSQSQSQPTLVRAELAAALPTPTSPAAPSEYEHDQVAATASIMRPRLLDPPIGRVVRRRAWFGKPMAAAAALLISVGMIALSWHWEPAAQWAQQQWSHWSAAVSSTANPAASTPSTATAAMPVADGPVTYHGELRTTGLPNLRLDAIVSSTGNQPTAMINGRVVDAGSVIDGFAVKSVESTRVTLEVNGRIFHLHMPRG